MHKLHICLENDGALNTLNEELRSRDKLNEWSKEDALIEDADSIDIVAASRGNAIFGGI